MDAPEGPASDLFLLKVARGRSERECSVAHDRPFEFVSLMHDMREIVELTGLAGQFQHIDSGDGMSLLQPPADAAVARERVVTEILADEETSAAMLTFRYLKLDARAVGMIALEAPVLSRGQNA